MIAAMPPSLSPPDQGTPLTDGVIALRPFAPSDLGVFDAAMRPGGNDGIWLQLESDSRLSLASHLEGWDGRGAAGPSLAVLPVAGDPPVGVVYFTPREAGSVELSYGTAPGARGRGFATRASRLAAGWLIRSRGWPRVELRISDGNLASQHVALRAGFQPLGRVRTWVPSNGREFEDLLYVMTERQLPAV
jgi:RimJ/RimL family protein N-acetyltransferase